jgi:signal transduction histidine kinase
MKNLALPPWHVLRAYLIGCVPLFIVYSIANETDGDFTRGFNLWGALGGTLRNAGPAFVLLLPVWAYTGWMERNRFSVTRMLVNHGLMAIVFAAAVQLLSYLLIWAWYDLKAADRARNQWFIWQGMFMMMMYWAAAGGFTAYRAVQRAELAALRNKLNPHFLFNTLHSIISLTRRDTPRAEQALHLFSDMLRYVLDTEKTGVDQVPLRQELDFTRDYLALESLRLGPRLNVIWDLQEDALDVLVPVLSVQPLVENSIKHAFNPRSAQGHMTIKAQRAGQVLHVSVMDDGPGGPSDAWTTGQGLGLKTVARRLSLLSEQSGQSGPSGQPAQPGNLRVDTQPGAGFAVHLTFPIAP